MIPALPVAGIRAAVAADDWSAAEALLAEHEAALRASCSDASLAETRCRDSWLELLAAQRQLVEELRGARDEAGRALDRLGRERRGVSAYLQSVE